MIQIASVSYVIIVAGVIVFQFCLIAGAPWGRMTQGGRHEGALPVAGRVAAALSILLLVFMGAGIASAAGITPNWPLWTAYVALAVQALSTGLNWITPSRAERLLWGPVTIVMLLLAAYVVFLP
ncbi:MAG: hypothetical protein ABJ000_06360 [Saccharospirillum sp.]|uniref:hypothetical protein n=1 Tax=Saccharospirillum sp. TaxID=2033801 RepID=UPI003297B317